MRAHAFMAAARSAGHSWQDIHGYLADKKQQAAQAGYSASDIQSYLGLGDPGALNDSLRAMMQQNVAADSE